MTYFPGVISNFVSYVCKVATGRYGPSLGAVSISNVNFLNLVFMHFDIILVLQKSHIIITMTSMYPLPYC